MGAGIKAVEDGSFWVMTDNGFGAKKDSADALLMFHRIKPDWKAGTVQHLRTVFLHDPDRKIPFLIVNEGTKERYLTGADLDIESIQFVGDSVWFGDEFGPYLLSTDLNGKVLALFETKLDDRPLRSPDHYAVNTPAVPGPFSTPVRRSRGFEGMAASKDGKVLYPLLEGPLWIEAEKKWETDKDGREFLRILEFDVAKGDWTGRSWKYRLEENGNNIGDFNMIDADTGLIIERDTLEGLPEDVCSGPLPARLLSGPGHVQTRLQNQPKGRRRRRVREEDRIRGPAGHQGLYRRGQARHEGRRVQVPVRHNRERGRGGRRAHRRRERQQPALLRRSQTERAGRQRVHPAPCPRAVARTLVGLANSDQRCNPGNVGQNVRFWPLADMPLTPVNIRFAPHMSAFGSKADMTVWEAAFAVAIGGKADMPFRTANVCF